MDVEKYKHYRHGFRLLWILQGLCLAIHVSTSWCPFKVQYFNSVEQYFDFLLHEYELTDHSLFGLGGSGVPSSMLIFTVFTISFLSLCFKGTPLIFLCWC